MKLKLLSLFLFAFVCNSKAQSVINTDCAQQHTGSYCFKNTSKSVLNLKVSYLYMPADAKYPGFKNTSTEFVLKPGESKYINDVMASPGVRNSFVATKETGAEVVDHGDFVIEECKTKTYSIK